MVDEREIINTFLNELNWIKDGNLKRKVVDVWKVAAHRGNWDSINDAPFTLLIEDSGRLTDHTIRITNIAKAVYDLRKEDINLDYLIAGALLHDVGKLLEYVKQGTRYVKGEYGNRFRHPVSGALLARELGLPDEVVLIIYAHSHEGDKLKRSPEAVIVNHSDFIDFEIRKSIM